MTTAAVLCRRHKEAFHDPTVRAEYACTEELRTEIKRHVYRLLEFEELVEAGTLGMRPAICRM